MASKSVLELAVGTGQWDSGLKKAKQALDNFTQANGGLQSALNKDSQSMQQFVKMMGQMDSTAKTAKGQMNDYKGTIEALTIQYNRMTDAQKADVGQTYLQAIDQMKQKYKGVADEVQKINQSLKSMPEPAAMSGGGLFGGDKLSGMLQVFGGNVMTNVAGMGVGFVSELGDMVKQSIELARQGEGIRIAFERLGRGDILDGLRQATHGTVSDIELMKAAVKFNDFRLPLEELGTMLAFAQQKAKDTGQSVDYMVDSIVTGLGRKSLMILDNLGLSAAEIKEKMKDTGDMTKAVGEIIREQMSKAGDYIETAADRATKANVEVQNAMERLGETFQPLTDAGTSMFNSLKVGALDFINKALRPMIDMLTEAGRMRKLYNAQKGTNDAKIQEMLEGLSKSELPQHQHRVNLAYWDKNINKYQDYLTDYKTWQNDKSAVGAHDRMDRMVSFQKETGLSFFSDVKEQLEVFKRQKADYVKLSKDLLTKKVEDNKIEEQSIDSLKKKLQELQAERKKAIAAGDTDLSKNLLKQINQTKADIKGLGGGTTTTTTTHEKPIEEKVAWDANKANIAATKTEDVMPSVWATIGGDAALRQMMGIGAQQFDIKRVLDEYVNDPDKEKREKANKTKDPMMELSKAINGLTSIRGGLEGMGIKLPAELEKGLNVLQGLMSIIQGVQAVISIFSTSTETANTIAVAANTVALGTLTAAVTANTMTNFIPFARGGVVHAANGYVSGTTYSGDQIPAMLNAGEVVLNRSQQGVLAASLQAVGQSGEGGGGGKPYVSGEMIWLGLTNYLNRSGRGEIVTSKRR